MSKENQPLLGRCPICGVARDIPGVGIAHPCRKPVNLMMNPEPDEVPEDGPIEPPAIPPLKPISHDKRSVSGGGRQEKVARAREAALTAGDPAAPRKRGRPAIYTPDERRALHAARAREKRRATKEGEGE